MRYILNKRMKGQRGFTALEFIVVIAIVGVLGTAAVMSITHVFQGSAFSNNYNTAMNNVRTAGDWLSRDVAMANASISSLYNTNPWPLDLVWYDENEDRDKYHTHYELGGVNGTDLIRTFQKNSEPSSQTTVAQNITTITAQFDTVNNANILTVTINAAKGNKSFQGIYKIHPRP